MEVYVQKEKKKEEKKKKKDIDHAPKSFAPNYLIGKDTHVGRDCRIWRIRLFL